MKKEQYLQILNYLKAFTEPRKVQIDIEDSSNIYSKIFWFSEVSKAGVFESITHSNFNSNNDYWLKLCKPISPKQPKENQLVLPQDITDYLVIEKPITEDTIPTIKPSDSLEKLPELNVEINAFIDNKWLDVLNNYLEEHKIYLQKFEVYEKELEDYNLLDKKYRELFDIYHEFENYNESFELIVCKGLLSFKVGDSRVFRHLFTQKVNIEFDLKAESSEITVRENEQADINLETGFFKDELIQPIFQSDIVKLAKDNSLDNIKEKEIFTLFDEGMDDVIRIFNEALSQVKQCEFVADIEKPESNQIVEDAKIFLAPALILRRKGTKKFQTTYEAIIKEVSEKPDDVNIEQFNDIVSEEREIDNEPINTEVIDPYFPLPYNDEQFQILNASRYKNKIVVQGPPGTGKSHTIANLISHLLATGNKILITSKKRQALEVLKDKLPEEIGSLAVNYLGGDGSSLSSLKGCINEILDKSTIPENERENNINEFEEELNDIRSNISTNKNQLSANRIEESEPQEINANYSGTLAEIVDKLYEEKEQFNWFEDNYTNVEDESIIEDINEFRSLAPKYCNIKETDNIHLELPEIDKLFTIDTFRTYVEKCKERETLNEKNIPDHNINNVKKVGELLVKADELCRRWNENQLSRNRELIDRIEQDLPFLQQDLNNSNTITQKLDNLNIEEFESRVIIQNNTNKEFLILKSDIENLIEYSNANNFTQFAGFVFNAKRLLLPKEIKEVLYLTEQFKVNDKVCDTIEKLKQVQRFIDIQFEFEQLDNKWETLNSIVETNFSNRFRRYNQFLNSLNDLLKIRSRKEEISNELNETEDFKLINNFDCTSVEYHKNLLKKHQLNTSINSLKKDLAKGYNYLKNETTHPIKQQIIHVITNRDYSEYQNMLNKIKRLTIEKEEFEQYKILKNDLNNKLPTFLSKLQSGELEESNLQKINDAIKFKHAYQYILEISKENKWLENYENIKLLQVKEQDTISKLASEKAWLALKQNTLNNLNLTKDLTRWRQAITNIGKGTGKRAIENRGIAKEIMPKCIDAVPCWIMPLDQVADTVKPTHNMFDYVIVDEASQLGPEALFLFYLAKKIIIVGDDKQTAPEYVGIKRNNVTTLIKEHLKDIPDKEFYGIDNSFFDHARALTDKHIVLREHFRCMPEIIAFSNQYFYAPENISLYPVRQFSENRLEPLKAIFCENGFLKGSTNKINEIEAEAIASKIEELIALPEYEEKDMGVIALQGDTQASIIEKLVIEKIGIKKFKERNIKCGKATEFQGDERDIIFLSMVVDPNKTFNAQTRMETERAYNVAASRAKDQMWLFYSVHENKLKPNDLRCKLLKHILKYTEKREYLTTTPIPQIKQKGSQPNPFDSWFEAEVANDIIAKGYKVVAQYKAGRNRRIDLVVFLENGESLAIECDGEHYHNAETFDADFKRQQELERLGWSFVRISYLRYKADKSEALKELWSTLEQRATISSDTNNEVETSQVESENNPTQQIVEIENDEVKEKPNTIQLPSNQGTLFNSNQTTMFDPPPPQQAETQPNRLSEIRLKPSIKKGIRYDDTHKLIFTNQAQVYKYYKDVKGKPDLLSKIKFRPNEKHIYITSTKDYRGFMLFAFKNGKIAKVSMKAYETKNKCKSLIKAFNVNSELIYIAHHANDCDLKITFIDGNSIKYTANKAKDKRDIQGNKAFEGKPPVHSIEKI